MRAASWSAIVISGYISLCFQVISYHLPIEYLIVEAQQKLYTSMMRCLTYALQDIGAETRVQWGLLNSTEILSGLDRSVKNCLLIWRLIWTLRTSYDSLKCVKTHSNSRYYGLSTFVQDSFKFVQQICIKNNFLRREWGYQWHSVPPPTFLSGYNVPLYSAPTPLPKLPSFPKGFGICQLSFFWLCHDMLTLIQTSSTCKTHSDYWVDEHILCWDSSPLILIFSRLITFLLLRN